jgi:ABC-type multidrug transport system fused ATPase/permease subunit
MTGFLSTPKKIASILLPSDRRKGVFMIFLMLFGMILEILSVVMVIPTIAFLVNQGKDQNFISEKIRLFLPDYPEDQYITLVSLLLVGVYFVKAVFLGFLAWRQMGFSYGIQQSISQRLFANYLRQPYSFHLNKNSSELLQNVIGEVNLFVGNVIIPGIELVTEIFVLTGIAALLLIYEPLASFFALGSLSLASAIFYVLIRNRISYFGSIRQFHERLRVQHLQQGLGGVKDVKLLGRENDFLSQYEYHNKMSIKTLRIVKVLNQFPRLWLEFLSIFGLAIIMYVVSYNNADKIAVIPVIGLFGAAAFRLIPSFNRILNSMQSYRFGLPVIDTIYNELKLNIQSKPVSSAVGNFLFNREIQISGLSFSYPDANKKTLDNISFAINYGQTVGIIGPSGSGKSTLVDVILGLLTPTGGNIEVDGKDISSSMRGWQNLIGYVPQTVFLSDDTLRRNIAFGIPDGEIDNEAVRKAVKYAQLEEYVSTLDLDIDAFVGERGVRISGGQRQRIGIARALYHNPSVLVLDEATSSLDNETEKGVMESIIALQGSKTILIVAHRLTTVQHCDKIFRIQHGKLVEAGTPNEIFEKLNKI